MTAGALALSQRRVPASNRPPRGLFLGFRGRVREGSRGIAHFGLPHLRDAAIERRPLLGVLHPAP
eukprot:7967654-Alexandrium_andersonii.AAC.1